MSWLGGALLALVAGAGVWLFERFRARAGRAELARLRHRIRRIEEAEDDSRRGSALTTTPAARLRALETALDSARSQIGAARVVLWDVDEPNGRLVPRVTLPGPPGRPVNLAGTPLRWVWEEQMPLRLESRSGGGWLGSSGGACVVPVGPNRLLSFEYDAGHLPADATSADDAGRYVAALLDLQRAQTAADTARLRFDHLLDVLERLTGATTAETWAAEVAGTARILIGGTGAAVASWDAAAGGRILAVNGDDGGPVAGHALDPSGSNIAIVAREAAPIVRDETRGGGIMPLAYAGERWYAKPRALAVIPLETVDGVLAVIAVWNADRAGLDESGLATLRTLAPYAALQLRQMVVRDTLRERAERDALTGLPNRGALDEKMHEEIALFRRYRRPVSVLVIDVDHFKQVNDTYGHDAGDAVLRHVGRILAATIRETDFAARLGGEEFAVILPETELPQAVETAERIRVAIERASIEHGGNTLAVRASAGVSACPAVVRDPAGLLSSADAALYASKQNGRNRVTAAAASDASSASHGKWA